MAVQPDTTTGLLTTTAGSINFTTSGTNLLTREHLPGDRFLVNGLELQIASITDENVGTLTEVCPPNAAVSGFPVRLRFQPDGARVAAQTRNLIDLVGNGTIQSLAELDGNADDLIGFLGPNTLRTFNRTDLIQGADYDIQVDTLAERATYDNRPENFSVLVSDVGDGRAAIYVKRSNEDGDWSNPAYVTGGVGPAPTIAAGTTTTVTPTTPANVSVVPNGSGGYTLNFSIPQGFQGVPGADGAQGPQGNGLQIDEVGPLSERSNYDNQPEGFTFFDTDGGNLYFRVGASGNWSDPIAFQGPPGTSGAIITTTNGVGNGTVGPYTLNAAPINSESVWVSISGVQQYDYVISGTNITFGIQVPTGVPWQVKTSGPLPVGVIPDGSITADKITNDPTEQALIREKIGADSNAGDVFGPNSSVADNIALFSNTTGKLIKDGGKIGEAVALTRRGFVQHRLTLVSGVPVMGGTNYANRSTVYFTPYIGNTISLYNGSNWVELYLGEISISLTGALGDAVSDIFVDYNGGTPQLVRTEWTNQTTRAVTLAKQNGILVKAGTPTQLFVGTIRTFNTGSCDWVPISSGAGGGFCKLYVWNMYNRVRVNATNKDTTSSWTYNAQNIRSMNSSILNRIQWVQGLNETSFFASGQVLASTSGVVASSGIGLNQDTARDSASVEIYHNITASPTIQASLLTSLQGVGRVGWNFVVQVEASPQNQVVQFFGNNYHLFQLGVDM